MQVRSEDRPAYGAAAQPDPDTDTVNAALKILVKRLRVSPDVMTSPQAVKDFLRLKMGGLEHEVFAVIHLDAQNRLLHYEEVFRGTLTQTSVYPREIVKSALASNASAAMFAHNHPSGVPEPSHADQLITQSLKAALALVDVKVLDHFIVGGADVLSFAERGLL